MKTTISTMGFIILFSISNAQPASYTATQANSFAIDLYKELIKSGDKNIFFSPISISLAMGMTYAGSDGETKAQVAKALYFPLDDKSFHKEMGSIQKSIAGKSTKGVEISLANQLWVDKSYKFDCSYLKLASKSYDAPVQLMNFRTKPDESRQEINRWVEQKTKNRIKDLLPSGSISDITTLVLTNAIYFKGQWANKFEESKTQDGDFTLLNGSKVKSRMMNANGKYKVYQGNDLKIIELPYVGDSFSMLVLLPNENSSIKSLEKGLQQKELNHFIDLMTDSDVRLSLPKFKFESGYELKPILSTLGMPIAFSNQADLSRMSGKKDLKIDEVFHKAFVEVSEEGTEAAAATAVVVVRKSFSIPIDFIANRPFLFIIRENASGNILFIGRMVNPT